MTFITPQVPLCFNNKEAQSQYLTHSRNCTVSEYFRNWFYLLLSSLSFLPHFLIHFLPLSYCIVGLSEKPCRKKRREMVPKPCRTLESLKNLWKPWCLAPTAWYFDLTGMECKLGTKHFYSFPSDTDEHQTFAWPDKHYLNILSDPSQTTLFSLTQIALNHPPTLNIQILILSHNHTKLLLTFKVQVQTLCAPQNIPWLSPFTLICFLMLLGASGKSTSSLFGGNGLSHCFCLARGIWHCKDIIL